MNSTTTTDPIATNRTPASETRAAGAGVVGATPFAGGDWPDSDDEFGAGRADERSFVSKLFRVFAVIIFSVIALVFTIVWVAVTLIGSAVRRLRPRASRRTTDTR
jgi:hypothetical protein